MESGSHDELMSHGRGYAKLYTTQKNLEEGYSDPSESQEV